MELTERERELIDDAIGFERASELYAAMGMSDDPAGALLLAGVRCVAASLDIRCPDVAVVVDDVHGGSILATPHALLVALKRLQAPL